jgi:hypothetical protein
MRYSDVRMAADLSQFQGWQLSELCPKVVTSVI